MTIKKVVLITALLVASESIFTGCTNNKTTILPQSEQLSEIRHEIVCKYKSLISQYDHLMRQEAGAKGYDWRFLAAICYHESRFTQDLVSRSGAVGIMQIMPSVARGFGLTTEQVKDPEVSIATAVKLLQNIDRSMRLSPNTNNNDRLKILLASYNAGVGHVWDARRLAAAHGASSTSWTELEKYLLLKGTDEHVNSDAVRNGAFRGSQTVKFVEVVMKQYNRYCDQYPA